METLDTVGVKHDSFDEVDRILIIVEQAKRDYEQEKAKQKRAALVATSFVVVSGVLLIILYYYSVNKNVDLYVFFVASLTLFAIGYFVGHSSSTLKETKLIYKRKVGQAAEVVREVVPILSKTENWSALRKYELRLRLTELDIAPEEVVK